MRCSTALLPRTVEFTHYLWSYVNSRIPHSMTTRHWVQFQTLNIPGIKVLRSDKVASNSLLSLMQTVSPKRFRYWITDKSASCFQFIDTTKGHSAFFSISKKVLYVYWRMFSRTYSEQKSTFKLNNNVNHNVQTIY